MELLHITADGVGLHEHRGVIGDLRAQDGSGRWLKADERFRSIPSIFDSILEDGRGSMRTESSTADPAKKKVTI